MIVSLSYLRRPPIPLCQRLHKENSLEWSFVGRERERGGGGVLGLIFHLKINDIH